MEKFNGTKEELKEMLETHFKGIKVAIDKGSSQLQAKTFNGMTIIFHTNNNIQTQSPNEKDMSVLNNLLELEDSTSIYENKKTGKKIFVVHGHDEDSLNELELMLIKWDLKPIIMKNISGNGRTLIEGLEEEMKSCDIGFVLLTPDDVGYNYLEGDSKKSPRARQNVILEMGMLLGILGRKKVVMIRKSVIETPSDVAGFIYFAYDNKVSEIKEKIRQQLKDSKIDIKD